MSTTAPPSLIGREPATTPPAGPGPGADDGVVPGTAHTLTDLMYDGFYALFMLKHGNGPQDNADFLDKMTLFLDEFTRGARKQGAAPDDIDAAKYAFSAAIDEIILRSTFSIRPAWEQHPLQMVLFGDHLAGKHFFNRLESLRARGAVHLQALEVFHMCLLLGYQGRYNVDGLEKLSYLTARLGDEIRHMKGKSAGFAPHGERPDQIIHKLRNDVPLWVLCAVFALVCALGYAGLRGVLGRSTASTLSAYNDIVKLAPRAANLSITLP